jgi:hypothetical protein
VVLRRANCDCVPWQVVEFRGQVFQATHHAGVEGSSPSLSTNQIRTCEAPPDRTIDSAGDLREVKSHAFPEAAIRLLMSAAE